MNKCLVPNYKESDYSKLGLQLQPTDDLDTLVSQILDGLEKQKSFSVSPETSVDRESFNDSINSLLDKIISDAEKVYTGSNISELRDILYNHLTEFKYTPTDEVIMAVISGTDLVTEGERQEKKFSDLVKEIQGTSNKPVYTTMEQGFSRDMKRMTIINDNTLITSVPEMNEAIESYLSSQYLILRHYLESIDKDGQLSSVMGRSLFINHNINPTSYQTLQIMYNQIVKLKNNKTFDDIIKQDWENKILNGTQDVTFYDAVDAYMKIAYFDDYLNTILGGYIQANNKMDTPIEVDVNGQSKYKYSFVSGNISAIKTWGVEERDAISEMSKFSKVLIESIPLYDFDSKTQDYGYMQVKDFVNTMSKLFDIIPKLSGNPKLMDALINFKETPAISMNTVFDIIFRNATSIQLLIDKGFDRNYLSYLYSIYKTVFSGNNSWSQVESKYKRSHGIPNTYSIVDTILKEMNSNVAANYVETVYGDGVETRVKTKFNTATTKFQVRDNANGLIDFSTKLKSDLLDKYKISGDSDFYITVGSNTITINPKGVGSLLDKKSNSSQSIDISINGLSDLSSFIPDISKVTTRRRIFNGQMTDEESQLMQVLRFIDDMLGTQFSKDENGLYSFYLLQRINKNNFREMIASASRGLLVTNIYHGFETTLKEDGTKYQRNELTNFLKDHQSEYINDNLYRLRNNREYFRMIENEGAQLTVIYGTESWLNDYSRVSAILHAETSKSTINSLTGKKFPNYTPSFLGSSLWFQIQQASKLGLATKSLLFTDNIDKINVVGINSEVRTRYGVKKRIQDLNNGELIYDSIVNKFIIPSLENNYYSQPTTYSDKTKFIIYEIALKELLEGRDIYDQNNEDYIEQKMMSTIGQMYKASWNNMLQDYVKLITYLNTHGVNTGVTITSSTVNRMVVQQINTHQLNNWLKTLSEKQLLKYVDDFNNSYPEQHLTFYLETHYRLGKGGLTLNELTNYYANSLYTSQEELHNRLYQEKIEFANNLLKYRVKLKYDFTPDSVDPITRIAKRVLGTNIKDWLSGSYLATGRITNTVTGESKLVSYGQVVLGENEVFELNPILNSYFMIDNLVGNNLRYTITGSELNHKIKSLKKLDLNKQFAPHIKRINELNGDPENQRITFYDIQSAIANMPPELTAQDKAIKSLFNKLIYAQENLGQNAQFKRNVPIPGTISPYQPKCINGMASKMNIAVVKDVGAKIFNFDGIATSEDAHDGSAWINPIASLLENWSLQSSEVGTIKKPIHHWLDDRYGTATLLKYAVDTMTNQWMRQAEGNKNGIIIRNLVKKMLGVRWNGSIDLINSCGFRRESTIDFEKDILASDNDSKNELYYRNGLNHYQIQEFGFENGAYYTLEVETNIFGKAKSEPVKVFHYFDDEGNHYTEAGEGRHTIDSLYELHTALGGIFSESLIDDSLQYSEASNEVVARWCNYVAIKKEGTDLKTSPIDQDHYDQPLKRMMIHMVANNSAVKNGAGNINQTERLYNNDKLSYMTVGTEYYGIQLDADHTADEAQLTEFSQVISSLDAGGDLHEYVSEIYKVLGQTALSLSQIELDAVEAFADDGNKTHLYEVIGRTIIDGISSDTAGLTSSILQNIKKEFNLQADHTFDRLKIPFSDPNIYSQILPTFISIINKKSIKRKYPGSGTVMVPGYDLSMIYDINGETYQYEDILKQAYQWASKNNITSTSQDLYTKNNEIVTAYLDSIQAQQPEVGLNEIMPTENVYSVYVDQDGTQIEKHISLNDIFDYYNYTDSAFNLFGVNDVDFDISDDSGNHTLNLYIKGHKELGSFTLHQEDDTYFVEFKTVPNLSQESIDILSKALIAALPYNAQVCIQGEISSENFANWSSMSAEMLKTGDTRKAVLDGVPVDVWVVQKTWGQTIFKKDVTRPRNLAPAKISFVVNGQRMSIYQHWRIKKLFLSLQNLENSNLSNEQKKAEEKRLREQYNPQQAFEEIYNHQYISEEEYNAAYEADRSPVALEVTDIQNLPAELIVSNLYASKFGLTPNTSMVDVTEKSLIQNNNMRSSDAFDIVFTGDYDSYISFKPLYNNSKCKKVSWKKNLRPFTEYPADITDRNIVNSIYAISDDNVRLFEIGREIKAPNVKMERDGDGKAQFYETDANGNIISENGIKKKAKGTYKIGTDGSVIEVVEFITKYRVKEKSKRSTAYEINKDAIKRIFIKRKYSDEELIRRNPDGSAMLDDQGKPIMLTEDQKFNSEVNRFIGNLMGKIYSSFDHNGVQLNSKMSVISGNILSSAWNTFTSRLQYNTNLYQYLQSLYPLIQKAKGKDNYAFNRIQLSKALKVYNQNLAKERFASYQKSKYFTVSRIPAQTLQSFMQMKAVGFTQIPSLQCFVSHWQTWLQGSKINKI